MSEKLIIRECTLADAPVIAEIYNESIIAGDSTMDDQPKTTAYFEELISNFSKRETILMMEDDSRIVGWGIIKKYSDRSGYRFCCETSVYLWRNEVGRGYGTKMKLKLIERCKEYGYHHLLARIFASNAVSIGYNKRLGYEVVGIQKEIGFKNGRWQDICVMQLVLEDVPPVIDPKYL